MSKPKFRVDELVVPISVPVDDIFVGYSGGMDNYYGCLCKVAKSYTFNDIRSGVVIDSAKYVLRTVKSGMLIDFYWGENQLFPATKCRRRLKKIMLNSIL
jgi:hypothetical protein